jgi:hypothetical protein
MFKNSHVVTDVSHNHKIGRVSPANGHHRSASLDLVRFHRLLFLAALVSMSHKNSRDIAPNSVASGLEAGHLHRPRKRPVLAVFQN